MTASAPSSGINPKPSPDGRQTRIDFFGSGRNSRSDRHVTRSQRQNEWWQTFTSWLKPHPKELELKLDEFESYLSAKNFTQKTRRSYLFMLRKFFTYLDDQHCLEISRGVIEDYNYDFFISGKYSRSYQLQFLNALGHYMEFSKGVRVNLKGLRKSKSTR